MTKQDAINYLEGSMAIGEDDDSRHHNEVLEFIIKALEQKPCEDCISREELYNELYDHFHNEDAPNNITEVTLGAVRNFVKNFPSVTLKKDGWIPCSKRMPEPKETENLIAKYYLVQNEYGDIMVARWDGKGWEQMYQHEYLEDDVVAWMPLPEPYKAETEMVNCKNTKCDNCVNHNYCDYEPYKAEERGREE